MSYGNIMAIPTSGASQETVNQDNLRYSGQGASHTMAKTDLQRMQSYKEIIKNVGEKKQVDPALIAGIISRESRAGNTIKDTGGKGDNGNAFGLMQVDKNWHTPVGEWDSEAHLCQGTQILVGFINWMRQNRRGRSPEQHLKAAIAAFNKGQDNVPDDNATVDIRTTGGDYSNDVVARAQWYKRNGF